MYEKNYSDITNITAMLLALGSSSFDTVIHNYRKSFLYVWSKHSNNLVKLLRCVSLSAFLWLLLCFIIHFYLFCLSVCMSLCVCVWAMLPDSNKMMMMMMIRRRDCQAEFCHGFIVGMLCWGRFCRWFCDVFHGLTIEASRRRNDIFRRGGWQRYWQWKSREVIGPLLRRDGQRRPLRDDWRRCWTTGRVASRPHGGPSRRTTAIGREGPES